MISNSEAEERKRTSPVHQLLGEPVAVNDEVLQECIAKNSFLPLAFKLYEEAMKVLAVCACTYSSSSSEECALPRNQAICAGLLVRIVKLMKSVATPRFADTRLRRCCVCAKPIYYRVLDQSSFPYCQERKAFFNQFVTFSLSPERELYDVIQKNVAERGGEPSPIEQRMLRSIDRLCRLSGVDISDVEPKKGNWGGSLRNRLIALGEGEFYAMQQSIPSHAVHGTWVDLIHHHLTEVDKKGFQPNPNQRRVDNRLMLPVCALALKAAHTYVEAFIPPLPERDALLERTTDLIQRIIALEEAHEGWINAQAG